MVAEKSRNAHASMVRQMNACSRTIVANVNKQDGERAHVFICCVLNIFMNGENVTIFITVSNNTVEA